MRSRRISIVAPVYNEAESPGELCDSILDHAGRVSDDLDVLFVDDGSTDGSGRVLAELCRRDPRVGVLTFGLNAGKSAARRSAPPGSIPSRRRCCSPSTSSAATAAK